MRHKRERHICRAGQRSRPFSTRNQTDFQPFLPGGPAHVPHRWWLRFRAEHCQIHRCGPQRASPCRKRDRKRKRVYARSPSRKRRTKWAGSLGESMSSILIVEDDRALLRGLKDNFETAGYEVRAASDGQRALEALLAQPPDLLLLDLMLPKLNGYEICRT